MLTAFSWCSTHFLTALVQSELPARLSQKDLGHLLQEEAVLEQAVDAYIEDRETAGFLRSVSPENTMAE